ncbi:MAG: hypothetical protein ACK5UP_05215, partial [Bacteroidota bacterium]
MPNKMFAQWCVDVLPKVYIFVQRLVSGTGRGFGSAPQQKHTRCGQPRWTDEKTENDIDFNAIKLFD